MNLPNRLTVMRVCLIPVYLLFYLWNVAGPTSRYIAVAVFVVASLTDWLDGYIARSRGLVTNFGKFMDPLADKLLVASALIAMVELAVLPAWAAIIIISRELLITGFRLLAAEQGIVIAADFWGKFKTVSQMVMIIFLMLGFTDGFSVIIGRILIYAAVALTVISMVDCLMKNKEVLH